MSDLRHRMEGARERVSVEWDDDHVALLLVRMKRRQRRRTVRHAGLAAGAAIAVAWVFVSREPDVDRSPVVAERASVDRVPRIVRFDDGSFATPITDDSELVVREVTPSRTRLELVDGSATFDVAPDRDRSFVVDAGHVRVIVVGTIFAIERRTDEVEVRVTRGRVDVEWSGGRTALSENERRVFPKPALASTRPSPPAVARVAPPVPTSAERPRRRGARRSRSVEGERPDAPRPVEAKRAWTAAADRGDYEAAFDAIEAQPAVVRDVPADLLLAADVARLSGHPNEALRYLKELTDDHASDPRAPLAAFTAGRILLSKSSRPGEAARAFGLARSLSPSGSLAEDAWAREVEALAAAGRASEARRVAELYLAAHPDGRRASSVERAAGIVPR